jgi:hypothetical protein
MATPQDAHSFYISSPYSGLEKERELCKQLITRRGHAYGDSYKGSTEPLVQTCQADVGANDHYILILGLRYGTRLPEHGGKSVTELEFEEAVRLGRPVHAFFIRYCDDETGIDFDPEAQAALQAFRNRVTDRCTGGVPVECRPQPDGRSGQQVFEEAITALAANPPSRPGSSAPSGAPVRRTYSPAELDAWVAAHQESLAKAFAETPSVRQRAVHVPLDVEFLADGGGQAPPAPLQPHDLAPLLADGPARVLLLSGDGGAGKSSLACAIGRWLLAGEPDGVVRLPVLLEKGPGRGCQCGRQPASLAGTAHQRGRGAGPGGDAVGAATAGADP